MKISHSTTTVDAVTDAASQLADLEAWISSDDARRTAQRGLQGRGLVGVEPEDVLQQAYVQVANRIRRNGAINVDEGTTLGAYTARVVRNVAVDMIRGRRTDGLGHLEQPPADDAPPAVEGVTDTTTVDIATAVADRLESGECLDDVRAHLFASISDKVWPESAALSLVTLAADPERDDDLGPRPEAGVDDTWRMWAALWLAGCRNVLPDRGKDNSDDAMRRKRRERAITKVKTRLHAAYLAVSQWRSHDER